MMTVEQMCALRWARTLALREADACAQTRALEHDRYSRYAYVSRDEDMDGEAEVVCEHSSMQAQWAHEDYAIALRRWCALDALVRDEESR